VPRTDLLLPVGISFYTFQSMAYTIDVYRGSIKAERSLIWFALYVSFFPQLVAGPIERPENLLPQLKGKKTITPDRLIDGAWLIGWGLFKKLFIADNLSLFVEHVFNGPYRHLDGAAALFGLYAFAFQIYCDFSGYTDIARGVAKWMGVELMLNFRLPYLATSPRDFWRRWHISLSQWLRDYLYIGLGGSRGTKFLTYRNLFLTMLLGGLWHGAAWTFVAWGAYHGALLIGHRLLEPYLPDFSQDRSKAVRLGWWALRVFIMFHLTCLGWLFFRATSLHQVWQFCRLILGDFHVDATLVALGIFLLFYIWPLLLMQALQQWKGNLLAVRSLHWSARGAFFAAAFLLLLIFGASESREFIYFKF
jgi:D-alanyl-lipoteichoic acid acyltransferase DltB (MBOAT superfamily)